MTKRWIVLAITSTAACGANASASIDKSVTKPGKFGVRLHFPALALISWSTEVQSDSSFAHQFRRRCRWRSVHFGRVGFRVLREP
jgi:hypothetical protein